MRSFSPNEPEPITWIAGRPVHAAVFVVLVYVTSMIVTTVLMALKMNAPLAQLAFDSSAVLGGEVWRVATYAVLNPPSIWFVIDMFLLARFGLELERFFGRPIFIALFAGLYFVTPLLFTALGFWYPTQLLGQTGALGMFIAFATLYPNVAFFFDLLAKWLAWILVGIYTLIHLSSRNLPGLLSLWATAGFAFLFVRYQQGALTLPRLGRASGANGRTDLRKRSLASARPRDDAQEIVDTLLDKIASRGIDSLTPAERARLDDARQRLLARRG